MAEFASRGLAGTALGLGAGALGVNLLNGGLGGLFGGWNNGCCSESMPVNRYELGLEQTIGKLQADVALRDANIFNDQKALEMYKYVDGELKAIRTSIAAQEVKNAQIEGAFAVLGEKLSAQRNEFICALNRERDERCCGDNAIVNYVNATFYQKQMADVTTGTTTTAQNVYNPLSNCGCGCR